MPEPTSHLEYQSRAYIRKGNIANLINTEIEKTPIVFQRFRGPYWRYATIGSGIPTKTGLGLRMPDFSHVGRHDSSSS